MAASAAIGWYGLAFVLAGIAILWLALQRRAELTASDTARAPWGPWCASVGSGAPGGRSARAEPNPRPHPVTASDIMCRRALILRWLRKHGVPDSDASDVAGAVIDGAWKARDTYDPDRAAFDSWLYSIAYRLATVYQRSARVRYERILDISNRVDLTGMDPETAAERAKLYQRALAILTRLPPHVAATFIGCHVDYTGTRQYAAAAGLPLGTVWCWLRQARHIIARELRREDALDAHALARRRMKK